MASKKQTEYQKLEEKLTYKRRFCWEEWDTAKQKKALDYAEGYKQFLSTAKTERRRIAYGIKKLEKAGFVNFQKAKAVDLKKGKIYFVNHQKNCIAFDFSGSQKFSEGFNLVFSHVDSPRLDLKNNPLLENEKMSFLQTHYYGGIKKYQWVALPLSIQGTIALENGKTIEINIGDNPGDPVFMISDLLPHLGKDQMAKNASEVIDPEKMRILIGSEPVDDKEVKEKVKLRTLEILHKEYGITEEDFFSAEIQVVPAGEARDLGLDRTFVTGYGQDDGVCSYAALTSFLEAKNKTKPLVLFWCDKEEIGSAGNSSVESAFVFHSFLKLLRALDKNLSLEAVWDIFQKSNGISADVGTMVDPNYAEVFDERNTGHVGGGVLLEKYTGARGKSYASDANAEYMAKMRKLFNQNDIIWQTNTIGKIDLGGGGTLALYMAKFNMNIVDVGIGIFNMHAPWEIVSKADLYQMHEAYKVFYEQA